MAGVNENKNKELTKDVTTLKKMYKNNSYDSKIMYNLLSLCSKLNEITNDNNRPEVLSNYEKEIYTVNNKLLKDEEKVTIETENILKYLEEHPEENNDYLQTNLYNIQNKKISDYSKIKKEIVKMQLFLGMDITFYKEAYNLYLDCFKK